MFGDDPGPSVKTERVGFGQVSDTRKRGVGACAERLSGLTRGKRKTWLVSERSTKARGDAATTNGCKFYEKHAGAMRMML